MTNLRLICPSQREKKKEMRLAMHVWKPEERRIGRRKIDCGEQVLPPEQRDPKCGLVAGIPGGPERESVHACGLAICRRARKQLCGNCDWLFPDFETSVCRPSGKCTSTRASHYSCNNWGRYDWLMTSNKLETAIPVSVIFDGHGILQLAMPRMFALTTKNAAHSRVYQVVVRVFKTKDEDEDEEEEEEEKEEGKGEKVEHRRTNKSFLYSFVGKFMLLKNELNRHAAVDPRPGVRNSALLYFPPS
ncbi:unnamed protein product [Dibothriocephalus latus]|uniref:Uncharacterized protein n=1 Tax=Dibothriocephalus latus TaxID=60516 RepID=A0A3P7LWN8_DIBLA|nr:unnamed protein product [Dibothriocephalus latus]